MAFELVQSKIDFNRLRNPDLQNVFIQHPVFVYFQDLAAAGVEVHAAFASDNAAAITTGITNPATPRSVACVFAGSWDGGDITIIGTDQFGRAQTEVIADNPGNTVQGVKVWKTITSIQNETVGAGGGLTCTVNTGTVIGLPVPIKYAWGICLADGVTEAFTLSTTYHGFTPGTTAPNGAHDYTLFVPVDWTLARTLNIN